MAKGTSLLLSLTCQLLLPFFSTRQTGHPGLFELKQMRKEIIGQNWSDLTDSLSYLYPCIWGRFSKDGFSSSLALLQRPWRCPAGLLNCSFLDASRVSSSRPFGTMAHFQSLLAEVTLMLAESLCFQSHSALFMFKGSTCALWSVCRYICVVGTGPAVQTAFYYLPRKQR